MSGVRWGFADSLSVRVKGLGAFVWKADPDLCGPQLWPGRTYKLKNLNFPRTHPETLYFLIYKLTHLKFLWNEIDVK